MDSWFFLPIANVSVDARGGTIGEKQTVINSRMCTMMCLSKTGCAGVLVSECDTCDSAAVTCELVMTSSQPMLSQDNDSYGIFYVKGNQFILSFMVYTGIG